jgi:hypothetical protein
MNFNQYYFNEKQIDEKLSDVVKDVASAGPGGIAKAAAKGVGRKIANVFRGATGRTKTIAFEPNWLKIMKPVPLATYKDLINKYANWKTQKTKLGPKKNFTITDNRDGRLGEFSKDKFTDILAKFDSKMNNIEMDAEIPLRMHVYIYNNGGKAIFFDLPIDESGKKRAYAIGLDNKAERAFRQVHGMPFQDYELVTGNKEEEKESKEKKPEIAAKFEIKKQEFNKLVPKKINASNNSFSFFNLFKEAEDNVVKVIKKGEKWVTVSNETEVTKDMISKNKDLEYRAVKNKDDWQKDKVLQGEFEKSLEKPDTEEKKETNTEEKPDTNEKETNDESTKYGKLYTDIKDKLVDKDVKKSIGTTKASNKAEPGWVYRLNNNGKIYLYKGKGEDKYYIAFDPLAEKIINISSLIEKYKLEKTENTPEEDAAESIIYFKNKLSEKYISKANDLCD